MTIDMPIEPGADPDEKAGLGMYVEGGWEMLRERVVEERRRVERELRTGGPRQPMHFVQISPAS